MLAAKREKHLKYWLGTITLQGKMVRVFVCSVAKGGRPEKNMDSVKIQGCDSHSENREL